MCSGVGHCRKKLVGTMCPSYMATLEEQHSTRGRANALRSALSGKLPGGLESDALYEVMDLCLECKACKAECPSSVDMAKLKYEFLARYHERHGYPMRAHLFARIDRINRWMSPVARLANFILRSPANRWLLDRLLGIDRRRQMPALAPAPFSAWFRGRSPASDGRRGTVVFYNDTFTEYNEPGVGRAAVRLLEAAGFEVVLPERRSCCGRPLISKGFLEEARRRAAANVRDLLGFAERGWPIVGVEPSCLLAFRDDYLDLAPDAEAAQRVSEHVYLLDEFLVQIHDEDGGLGIDFGETRKTVLFHGHCHQKALAGTTDTVRLMNLPAGFDVEEIASGCCGMAGSFGYEREHYDVSMTVGRERLFDVIEAEGDVEVAATGTSCRHQIADATGRKARHWAEVLADALP
jgi:Fe-S oxidoreductase